MEKTIDSKRKSRNLSEKKRRDQFNNLINELNNLIDPHFNNTADEEEDICSGSQQHPSRFSTGLPDFDDLFDQQQQQQQQQPSQAGLPINNDFFEINNYRSGQQRQYGSLLSSKTKATSSTSSLAGSASRPRKMDKSSVLKCAMEFLKKHAGPQQQSADSTDGNQERKDSAHDLDFGYPDTSPWKPPYITDDEFSVQMLEALDAFIVVCEVNSEAKIIYSSDTLTNLLNYTGTCNSLRHHDYVSLFDLIAPYDKPQIEKLFNEQTWGPSASHREDTENLCQTNNYTSVDSANQTGGTKQPNSRSGGASGGKFRPISTSGQNEYISLAVNFRNGLNLTEIKQKRLQQRTSVLQPYGQNRANPPERSQSSLNTNSLQQEQQVRDTQDIYMQIVVEHESTGGRSQQSIAEQQRHLLSDGRREEQEHNQHQQQQHQQQQRHVVEMMQVDSKQLNDDQQLSDGSNGNTSDDAQQQNSASSSGINSDENDQPSGTGSDDASDSNQSQNIITTERRHHYRHYHHHGNGHHASQHSHQRRPKIPNRQQYELVRLMATFKGLDDNNMKNEDTNHNRYKFEEPPPMSKSRYFICIGRLDVPRLSYDLKIIVPPMRSGTNVFHNNQFLSKHTLKWRFLWVDNRAPAIIGYLPFEVLGTSGYDYYHWDDLDKLVISHEGLMRDGQASSGPYRFLTKGQQWIWLQTRYCIILKPQYYAEQRKTKQLQQQQQYLDKISLNPMNGDTGGGDGEGVRLSISFDTTSANNQHQHNQMGTDQHYLAPPVDCDQQQQQNYMDNHSNIYDQQQQICNRDNHDQNLGYIEQQHNNDGGNINYRTTSSCDDNLSYQKKFRVDQDHSLPVHQASSKYSQHPNLESSAGCGVQYSEQVIEQQNEQRRYEKLLKSNDLIKKQSIKAGNSFSSRSLDQFKFIICTHTVIGFDEPDGYVNSTAPQNQHLTNSTVHNQYSTEQVHDHDYDNNCSRKQTMSAVTSRG